METGIDLLIFFLFGWKLGYRHLTFSILNSVQLEVLFTLSYTFTS